MRVLVAPDKLKGSLGAEAAAKAIAQGVKRALPAIEVDSCPLADGGDGTVAVLGAALAATAVEARVHDPRGRPIDATWAFVPSTRTAIIESASAIGLAALSPADRDPMTASSFGLGELVLAALDAGAERILLGLGGSATTDGGMGLAQALGVRFSGVATPATGADLSRVTDVDVSARDPRLARTTLVGLCDVESPLFGEEGAAIRFAPQKGASEATARRLDAGLARLARLVPEVDPHAAGAGAAGGIGFGVLAFLAGRLRPGASLVMDAVDFDSRVALADLVITAEGRLDRQSLAGKVIGSVIGRSRPVPVVALAGSVLLNAREIAEAGLAAAFSLCGERMNEAEAMARAAELLEDLACRALEDWLARLAGAEHA